MARDDIKKFKTRMTCPECINHTLSKTAENHSHEGCTFLYSPFEEVPPPLCFGAVSTSLALDAFKIPKYIDIHVTLPIQRSLQKHYMGERNTQCLYYIRKPRMVLDPHSNPLLPLCNCW